MMSREVHEKATKIVKLARELGFIPEASVRIDSNEVQLIGEEVPRVFARWRVTIELHANAPIASQEVTMSKDDEDSHKPDKDSEKLFIRKKER